MGQSVRRLAAIMAADVVGSSRLIETNETYALAAIREALHDVLVAAASSKGGRLIKTMGDGALIEFASPLSAVETAEKVQLTLSARAGGEPPDRQIMLRIGINLGDVVVTPDGDVYGDGVNIAARLEPLSPSGGIAISGKVYDELRGRLNLEFFDVGEQALKNIARPVRVYVRGGSGSATQTAYGKPALPLPEKPSIAVLPFLNLSGDPEQEYFVDGIVEEIITTLSRVKQLFVISSNSSFVYKGRAVDVRQVGRELGVRYVLGGSLRRASGHIRITGHLAEAASAKQIWADRFDGSLFEIFHLQDHVTEGVVSAIEPNILRAEIDRSRSKRTDDLTAYDLYLRAHPEFQSYTRDGFLRAQTYLEQAVSIDPEFADAWTALADCLGRLLISGWLEPITESKSRVCDTALKAVAMDPDNGSALAVAAWALSVVGHDAERGCEYAEHALRVDPNSAYVRMQSAYAFLWSDQLERAMSNFEIARRFNPFDTRAYTTVVGLAYCHLFAGRYLEAIRCAERAIELAPNFAAALRTLAVSLAHSGRLVEARRIAARLREVQPTASISWTLQRPFGTPRMMTLFIDGLRKAGLPE